MDLPLTKPLWLVVIILGKIELNLTLISFAIILLDTLRRLIGRLSESCYGESTLGSMIRRVWDMNLGIESPLKKAKTALWISSAITFQALWYNFPLKPSGPRELLGSIEKTQSLTSCMEYGRKWCKKYVVSISNYFLHYTKDLRILEYFYRTEKLLENMYTCICNIIAPFNPITFHIFDFMNGKFPSSIFDDIMEECSISIFILQPFYLSFLPHDRVRQEVKSNPSSTL